MSLRSKRLARKLDPAAAAFLDSTPEDAHLAVDDVLGSLGHVSGLEHAGILTSADAEKLAEALRRIYREALDGTFQLDPAHEDVHLNVEVRLIAELGDLGKRLHTGRSRNDQVALDLRLFARRWSLGLAKGLHDLVGSLMAMAKKHPDAILPGYTHMQVAQPVQLAFQLQAHAERFQRDLERLRDAFDRLLVSPLGAGALAGSRHALDPAHTATVLGFKEPFRNAMDAVSDRDFLAELLFVATLALTHASGLAEELILFTSQEFAFATIRDDFATGSSIMPQKKNPDVFEATRGRAAAVLGSLVAAIAAGKNLSLAYNRDLQDQKRVFVETYPRVAPHIELLARAIRAVEFHPARMADAAERGYGDATDLADYLVGRGVPFRDAHDVAASAVRLGIDKGLPLRSLPIDMLQKLHPKIGRDVRRHLGAAASVAAKKTAGSTQPAAVAAARLALARAHRETWSYFEDAFASVHRATQRLLGAPLKEDKT
ncbi:MAG TPA: argininosuccinate lyase [Candidatus Thermoplasmatota archaeon]|nr:argininosuccinate lyase [Candidatus Thermoplasmatota archaeon]